MELPPILKPVVFRGNSLDDLRTFPASARRRTGHQLDFVQRGREPDDWKPMLVIGQGVREIRIRDDQGTYLCLARFPEDNTANAQVGDRPCHCAIQRSDAGVEAMKSKPYESVWDAISDTPGEAANMKARSALMIKLHNVIKDRGLTQAKAAKLFGVTQPRISDLMRGKIDLFSLDTLINMAATAGLHVELRIAA